MIDHTESFVRRAYHEVLVIFGGLLSALCVLVFIPVVGFVLFYKSHGPDTMFEELEVWQITLQATGIVALGLFVFKLVQAPFLQRNEARNELFSLKEATGDRWAVNRETPKGRIIVLFNGIDSRLTSLAGLQVVRLEPRDLAQLGGLIAELGDFSPVEVVRTIRQHNDSILMDGALGKSQGATLLEVELNIKESLHD